METFIQLFIWIYFVINLLLAIWVQIYWQEFQEELWEDRYANDIFWRIATTFITFVFWLIILIFFKNPDDE